MQHHIDTGLSFDVNDLAVGIQVNFVPCPELIFCINAVACNQINILLINVGGQALCGGGVVA